MAIFCIKQRLFIKKETTPFYIKLHCTMLKKLKPQISVFIKKNPFLEITETPAASGVSRASGPPCAFRTHGPPGPQC